MAAPMQYLAVDDDPAFHFVLTQMMTQLGYEPPVCVTTAAEALTLLANPHARFDAILLDIQMPVMDGIEACRHIRAMPHLRDMPIMMVTTMNGRDYVDQAFAVGATDYLTKPINRIELQARLGMLDRLVKEHALAQRFGVLGYPTFLLVSANAERVIPIRKTSNVKPEDFVRACRQAVTLTTSRREIPLKPAQTTDI